LPLNTKWLRNDEIVKPEGGWTFHTLSAMMTVAFKEGAPELEVREGLKFGDLTEGQYVDFSMAPIYYMEGCGLVEHGYQVVMNDHTFDINGQHLEFKAGDVLRAWRS
jgi:hypothetical protein